MGVILNFACATRMGSMIQPMNASTTFWPRHKARSASIRWTGITSQCRTCAGSVSLIRTEIPSVRMCSPINCSCQSLSRANTAYYSGDGWESRQSKYLLVVLIFRFLWLKAIIRTSQLFCCLLNFNGNPQNSRIRNGYFWIL